MISGLNSRLLTPSRTTGGTASIMAETKVSVKVSPPDLSKMTAKAAGYRSSFGGTSTVPCADHDSQFSPECRSNGCATGGRRKSRGLYSGAFWRPNHAGAFVQRHRCQRAQPAKCLLRRARHGPQALDAGRAPAGDPDCVAGIARFPHNGHRSRDRTRLLSARTVRSHLQEDVRRSSL